MSEGSLGNTALGLGGGIPPRARAKEQDGSSGVPRDGEGSMSFRPLPLNAQLHFFPFCHVLCYSLELEVPEARGWDHEGQNNAPANPTKMPSP